MVESERLIKNTINSNVIGPHRNKKKKNQFFKYLIQVFKNKSIYPKSILYSLLAKAKSELVLNWKLNEEFELALAVFLILTN